MPRIKSDILELFEAVGNGTLKDLSIELDERTCVTVMLVAGGYPGDYEKGKVMTGFESCNGSLLFHAGTKVAEGNIVTNGGRVLAVSTIALTMDEALATSFSNAAKISFDGKYYRRDIGFDLK
jgi:phosphoribosylamine--glycine ligase